MKRFFAAALALMLVQMLGTAPARADTPIVLFKSFAGNINFTGTEGTLRTKSNGANACSTTNSVTMNLSGIPSGATVLAAYLYWAGSGSTTDYTVTFDGKSITAPVARQYTSGTVGYNYFGGAADVTDQVKARGNASYVAKDLSFASSSLFCDVEGVLGGFQLLVVYSQSQETFRVLNVYEGFQYIRNSSVELTLANFLIPNPIGNLTGRVGHITWEGDSSLSGGGETLRYNGVEQTDSLNTSGNQFNSVSNINGDAASYGIDFDAYTVKSPVIGSGQKSAKTTYTSGQDLVLLNAEIIAAPNVPATDRGVTMTLDGPLVPSSPTTYTISVVNNGPMDEGGPLIVTGTLPAALIPDPDGIGGTDWTCSVTQQVFKCTYKKLALKNATLPAIKVTVTPAQSATGLITFAVTVGGALFDYYDGNDTSTVTARVGAQTFKPVFVFTDGPCVHNKPFGDPEQTCNRLTLDKWNANTDLRTWITFTAKEVPTALANSATTLPMRFALSCVDPTTHAFVRATYNLRSAAITLPLCASNGVIPDQASAAWSGAYNILYPGGSPSSQATTVKNADDPSDFVFRYPDVGRIELFVTDNQQRMGSTGSFVSRPTSLQLLAPSTNAGREPASATDPQFVSAGTPFAMTVRALMPGLTDPAPNFGREQQPVKIDLRVLAATTVDGSPLPAMVADFTTNPASTELPFIDSDEKVKGFGFGAFSAGIASGNFRYDDVGVLKIEARIAPVGSQTAGSYLGSGDVPGNAINVGRFYPDHFDTFVTGPMACIQAAVCPTGTTAPVQRITTMAYSGQPFGVRVEALNALGEKLTNYRLELARNVALTALTAPNGGTAQASPYSGTTPSVFANTTIAAGAFAQGAASLTSTYTFPKALAYDRAAPAANNWPQPVSVYVRATESSGADGTTSKRGNPTVEGGVQVVAGRMWVPNLKGTAGQPLNAEIRPQLFGTVGGVRGWYDVTTDSATTYALADVKDLAKCANLPGATNCNLALTVDSSTSGTFVNGSSIVKFKAPAVGSNGIVTMWLVNPAWLPSMQGTLTYGVVTKPYTYLREIY